MTRRSYLIAYDICDPGRLRAVFRACRAFGDHLQYSVFRADLSKKGRAELEATLRPLINAREDQILIIDLGPTEGTARGAFKALGRPYTHPERHAVIV